MSGRQGFTMPEADAALRRCALALHSVGQADRTWLLGQLPLSQRATLEQLVSELQTIGIPRDPQVARVALGSLRPASVDRNSPGETGDTGHAADGGVSVAPPSELAQLLKDEPPALIAPVLGLESRERCDAVLIQLSASKRRQVQELLAEGSVHCSDASAPKLREALSQEVSQRLAARAPSRQTPERPVKLLSRWRRLVGAVT